MVNFINSFFTSYISQLGLIFSKDNKSILLFIFCLVLILIIYTKIIRKGG